MKQRDTFVILRDGIVSKISTYIYIHIYICIHIYIYIFIQYIYLIFHAYILTWCYVIDQFETECDSLRFVCIYYQNERGTAHTVNMLEVYRAQSVI